MLAQVASALRIPAIIIELRVFEYREELANRGRSINRPSSQVPLCDPCREAHDGPTCHACSVCAQPAWQTTATGH